MTYSPVKSPATFLCSPYHDGKEGSFTREHKEEDAFIFTKLDTYSHSSKVLSLISQMKVKVGMKEVPVWSLLRFSAAISQWGSLSLPLRPK